MSSRGPAANFAGPKPARRERPCMAAGDLVPGLEAQQQKGETQEKEFLAGPQSFGRKFRLVPPAPETAWRSRPSADQSLYNAGWMTNRGLRFWRLKLLCGTSTDAESRNRLHLSTKRCTGQPRRIFIAGVAVSDLPASFGANGADGSSLSSFLFERERTRKKIVIFSFVLFPPSGISFQSRDPRKPDLVPCQVPYRP